MTLKLIDFHKNIGEILDDVVNIDKNYIIFLDWDETVISTHSLKRYKFEFRNERNKYKIIETFKRICENNFCLGLYILTYRSDPLEVQGEATELKIMEYFKSEYKHKRTEDYSRVGPIISVDRECPKIKVLREIIREDFNRITNSVGIYFVDDDYQNIMSALMTHNFENFFICFFPESNNSRTISNNIKSNIREILRYLK